MRPTRVECALERSVAEDSRCPSALVIRRTARMLSRRESMTFINVGSNKGYAIVDFLQRFHRTAPSKQGWLSSILNNGKVSEACGVCHACQDPQATQRLWAKHVAVHAFDIYWPNVALLRALLAAHNLSSITTVHHAAVSNRSGSVFLRRRQGAGAGDEGVSAKLTRGGGFTTALPSVSLDNFTAAHAISRVSWLSVDAEGLDALVLEGVRESPTANPNPKFPCCSLVRLPIAYWSLIG